jgi:hypothetical protein
MARWQQEGGEESIFWKFMHMLLPQIDSRGKDELFHEPEDCEPKRCHLIRLGSKKPLTALIVENCGLSKCIVRYYAANETTNYVCERKSRSYCLVGVAHYIVMFTPSNTKPDGRST